MRNLLKLNLIFSTDLRLLVSRKTPNLHLPRSAGEDPKPGADLKCTIIDVGPSFATAHPIPSDLDHLTSEIMF